MRSSCVLCAALASLLAPSASAQGNDLYGPAGGRAALMGNTGVALSRDGSAPFYNPATIVHIEDERLAFSANFYALGLAHFDRWHAPAGVAADVFGERELRQTDLQLTTFRSLPSSLCLFLTLEELAQLATLSSAPDERPEDGARQKLALCLAAIESDDVELQAIRFEGQTQAGGTTQVQSLQRSWGRIYVGPTYSVLVSDDLAFGASLQGVYSSTSFGVSSSSLSERLDGGGTASSLATSARGRSFDLTATVGATYRLGRVTLGASARAPAIHLLGSYDATFQRSSLGEGDPEPLVATGTGSFRAAPPLRFALGAGLDAGPLRLALDTAIVVPAHALLHAELAIEERQLLAGDVARSERRASLGVASRATVNPSLGAELFVSSQLSVLAGLSTSFSGLAELVPRDSAANLVLARMHHLMASFGIGSYWDGGALLFGVQLDYGWGQTLGVDAYAIPNAWAVVDTQSYQITFVISGSASLREIARVVDSIRDAGG